MKHRSSPVRGVLPSIALFSVGLLGALAPLSCANPKPPLAPDTAPMGVSPEGGTDTPTTPLPGTPASPSLGQ